MTDAEFVKKFNEFKGTNFRKISEIKGNGFNGLTIKAFIESLSLPSVIGSSVNADLLDACESLLKAVDDEGWQTDKGGDYEEQIKTRRAIKRAKENCR